MTGTPSVDVFGGIRVVELAQWVFVPVAGSLLADWGADVIKVERPDGGDPYRGLESSGSSTATNQSMDLANRNKRSVTIDLKTDAGHTILLQLLEEADVFVTNFLPSVLDRLGLGIDELRRVNPRLIYARGHGYGVRGDDADTPAYDSTSFWARGAVAETLAPTGMPEPLAARGALGDRYAATQLAFGIAGALLRRERTGNGSVVDVSLLGTALWMLGSDAVAALQGQFQPSAPLGRQRESIVNPLAASYQCADHRWLMICCLQADKYWVDLCTLLGRADLLADDRFGELSGRGRHALELAGELAAAFAMKPLAAWRPLLDTARIPWGPYQRVDELLADPAVVANGYLGNLVCADGSSVPLPSGAVQFDGQPAALHRSPNLGEHTDDVLASLGYTWDEVIALKVEGVIL